MKPAKKFVPVVRCSCCELSVIVFEGRTWSVDAKTYCNYCYWHYGDLKSGRLQ